MLRASAEAEKVGIPTVSIISSAFMKQSALVAKGLGVPLAIAEYPGAPMVDSDDELRAQVVERLLPDIIRGLTAPPSESTRLEDTEPEPGTV